ncbi:unnamed protein product [Caenorhabditis bovis]|uniref:N-acetyltransferase domain-containing protein n=1 Tax=Caenorhabditis bovis TaxID=2654633 RepID=A0A8S1ENG9_9PELO|nr:unnamed protein product [Caenorhabditis bovis]
MQTPRVVVSVLAPNASHLSNIPINIVSQMSFEFTTLKNREDLLQSSVKLLNEEWPRSDGSREHSQKKSCRHEPPMSFVLVCKKSDELVGHARICRLPNNPAGLWIESVLIRKDLRGIGLGRFLMEKIEEWMAQNGFDEAYLSTDDQVEFYRRCGYSECDPILHSTTATSVFPPIFCNAQPTPPRTTSSIANVSNGAAPLPPPPPPPTTTKKSSISTTDHQYMSKRIKQ